jgi:hypothetical protein
MSLIVLIIAILVSVAGLVALGIGILLNGLAFGQTLILAGTIGLSAGLILVALAIALGHLAEIAEALKGASPRPAARGAEGELRTEAEPIIPALQPARVRTPLRDLEPPLPRPEQSLRTEPPMRTAAARPVDPRPAEPRASEPRSEPAVDVSANAIERLRSSLPRPERAVPEVEAAPLSPNGGSHPPATPSVEAKAHETARSEAPPLEPPREPRLDFLLRSRQPRVGQGAESFDSVWPRRAAREEGASKVAEAAVPSVSERSETAAAPKPEPGAGEEPRNAAILKSGVVDGMAYTLYADGSIEAQLPQGTVRFGSIVELRAHIENNS